MDFVGGYADDWWKLSRTFDSALHSASGRLDSDGKRRLRLGSPVLIGRPTGDVMRMPVILSGGKREFPVGYVTVEDTRIDKGRIALLVQRFEARARAVIGENRESPIADDVSYP
jgi:hypothetical protein